MRIWSASALIGLASLCCGAWEETAPPPEEVVQAYVQGDAVWNEEPCDWRETIAAIFRPSVQHCRSAREAALYIAANISRLTGAYYSMDRRKANMNALEALAEKKISCTGQSILLACALRSVGIPARAVAVFTWGHVQGNHTWTEAYIDGSWRMIEFGEKDFNTPWVMENIGLLNPAHRSQRIYAISPRSEVPSGKSSFALVDVTDRYMALAHEWYRLHGLSEGQQRLMVDVQPRPREAVAVYLEAEDGTRLAEAASPTQADDVRYFARLAIPRCGPTLYLRLGSSSARVPVCATPTPAQVVRLCGE